MMKHRAWIFSLGLALPLAAAWPAQAQLFGESDEVKAARQQHEDDQDARANQLAARIQAQEDKIQSLTQSLSQATGANEELSHRLQLLSDKIDRDQKDFAYRLCTLSAQQLGATGDQGLNCAASGSTSYSGPVNNNTASAMTPGAPLPPLGAPQNDTQTIDASGPGLRGNEGGPRQLGRPPGTLGTLSSSNGDFAQAPPGGNRANANARRFDVAMNLLGKAQYAEASAAFRSYADSNPDDQDLSPQAIFWIGNIAYVQQDYGTAINAFAEQIKKYPASGRSPDSMLKLGQALVATGQTKEGCTALGALKARYPKAPATTIAAAATARRTANCR